MGLLICCGRIEEITTQGDMQRVYLCTICGRQGGEDAFPEPHEPEPPSLSWRDKLAERVHRLADRISQ